MRVNRLQICYLPSQWLRLEAAQVGKSVCVVIDVVRATSTIAAALAHGAKGVRPVARVAEAFSLKARDPLALLAGERGGCPLPGFDLGNSPREVNRERISGRELILTTTNGTQALAVCRYARAVITASLLNLQAVAARLRELGPPWVVLCAGFEGQFGLDDAMVAGALAEALDEDHALVAVWRSLRSDITAALAGSLAGRELYKAGLEGDLPFCAQTNLFPIVPTLDAQGVLRQVP